MKRSELKIGLFGFGCVGSGLYEVLHRTSSLKAEILSICVKNRNKKRSIPAENFTFKPEDILDNENINVVVELIDDAEAAFEIVKTALKRGKAVVSANKKMIADYFSELLNLQRENNVPFLYEAAACASIPVIRNLEEYYDNDLLNSIEGIINGSTNYILSKMETERKTYDMALTETQSLGFAESDPWLDVSGRDARYKLSLLIAHAFGLQISPDCIPVKGIESISATDVNYAAEKGYRIKLIANAVKSEGRLFSWVMPRFILSDHRLFHIDNENNGLSVEGVFSDKQFFSGKGAGSYPTASAVLSDISALSYNYRYEYKKLSQGASPYFDPDIFLRVYCRTSSTDSLDSIPFITVEEKFSSRRFAYATGIVNLGQLWKAGFLEDNELSVIQLGLPVRSNEVPKAVEECLAYQNS